MSNELVKSRDGAAPELVVVCGDLHHNGLWSHHVITQASKVLATEPVKIIFQLGDFGFWSQHDNYIWRMSELLGQHDMLLLWVDGNHEHHDKLAELRAGESGPVAVDKAQRIWHLPRGYRFELHGRRWLTVGGAGSPDAPNRTAGFDWFPQEVITAAQADEIAAAGSADVILAHDCPRDWYPPLPPPPAWWRLEPCIESARQLQRIVDAVEPRYLMHGHLHVSREDVCRTLSKQDVRVTGLDMDGSDENWRVLNTRTMTWVPRARS